jgi:F-type H+-transporting ATPase subunit a
MSWLVWSVVTVGLALWPVDTLAEYLTEVTISGAIFVEFVPLVGALFVFILASNWLGALGPWSFFEIPSPSEEVSAPTNDVNTTAWLALLTSHATFYTGLSEYRAMYPAKYLQPVAFIAPLNLLEEFSKPLSLSFRLLGNILADELTLGVLYGLVPLGVPVPVFLLGLFTSGIQAVVFATLAAAYLGETLESLAS